MLKAGSPEDLALVVLADAEPVVLLVLVEVAVPADWVGVKTPPEGTEARHDAAAVDAS